MKKEAIIDLIKSDLEEIGTLVETFREPDRIAQDFIELLRQKCEGVNKEITLLNYWSTENMPEAAAAELVARVPSTDKVQEPISAPKAAKTEPKQATEPKKAAEPQREEVPDYFADELEKMDDPLANISFLQTTDKESDTLINKEVAPAINPTAKVKPVEEVNVAKGEPKPMIATPAPKVIEPTVVKLKPSAPAIEKAPVKQAAPAPNAIKKEEPAKHTPSNAADIATYGTPVSDITKAIGINDRFLYQRELFNGNKQALDEAIAAVNLASSYNQAYIYLKQFGWDESDSTVEAFLKAVHRRFI